MAENKNYDNIRIYGDLDSEVFLGPKGSTLPIDLADPAAPFVPLGWLSEEGINLAVATNVEKFRGYQGGSVLKTRVTSTDKSFTIQCLEETPGVTELYYGHGAPTISGVAPDEVAKIDLPESIPTIQRAGVVRFVDEGITKLLCCENLEIGNRGEVAHTNTGMTMYEFTLEIIGAAYILTNNPAYLPVTP